MSNTRYNIVLSGQVEPGHESSHVSQLLATLMNLAVDKALTLLQGKATTIKSDIDGATAQRYLDALQKTGAEYNWHP
jgi:hypothetical protein